MTFYLKYDSIYNNISDFDRDDITVTEQVLSIYDKHVENGNIISWDKEDFPETLTKVLSIGFRDSDAYNNYIYELKTLVPESEIHADWVKNTNYRLISDV